jgi:hypothetical protein
MRVLWRTWLLLAVSLGLMAIASAQTPAKPTHKSLPWNDFCHGEGSFCFKYPPAWSMLGEVFAGNGVVVAPQQKQEREFWDAVTVALVIPSPQGGADAVTIDQVIEQAVSRVREGGQNFETLERQRRRVDGKPAQSVKLHYVEKASGREWIEKLVFIEGPDAEVYSLALKCAPSSLVRMEPAFSRIVDSWTLPEVEPPTPASLPKGVTPEASTPPKL